MLGAGYQGHQPDLHLGHDDDAIDWLSRSVDRNPKSACARLFLCSALGVALGFAQLLLQQYDASLASLRHAIALNPNAAGACRSYGNALGAVGEHRASIEAFERSPPVVLA